MTNPPFHPSQHSLLVSASAKSRPPNSICTGSASEMITPGGEVGFVTRLIRQSASLREGNRSGARAEVQWWSSMLGKLSSVGVVLERLRKTGCRNWAVKEFVHPGAKTRRWGVAWSFAALRPPSAVARAVGAGALKAACAGAGAGGGAADVKKEGDGAHEEEVLEGGLLPFPAEFEFEVRHASGGAEEVGKRVDAEIGQLDLRWQWKPALGIGLGIAQKGDCWSRKARRRKQQELKMKKLSLPKEDAVMRDQGECDGEEDDEEEEEEEPELVFKIQVSRLEERKDKRNAQVGVVAVVMLRWLQGRDHVLFESFCGWLKRKIDLETR